MKDYLHSIIGSFSFSKRLLIWDAYKCHISQATRKETDKMKLHTATIPGGCTKFILAPDVVWNASFKSYLRRSYDTWLSEPSVHEYTKGGNLKPPSRSLLCQWIKEAWNDIPEERIRDSFRSCAITTKTDGSEDNHIHCFKAGQPCEAGGEELLKEMETLNEDSQNADKDPFASDVDEEETEENEACIDDTDDCDDETTSDEEQ